MKPPPLDQDAEKEAATRHEMQTHNHLLSVQMSLVLDNMN